MGIYKKIIHLGTGSHLKIEDAQRVRLTNILAIFPGIFYVFFVFFGFYHRYYFPPILCCCLIILISAGLYVNGRRNYMTAKFILFSANSFAVLATQNILNIDHSITCYFFPLFIAYLLVYDVKREWKGFLPAFLFTLLCLAGCFLLPHQWVYGYNMSEEIYRSSVIMNYLFPFCITLFFMWSLINIYAQTQEKLISAREDAEKANRAKSDFLSNMSHELRTPLNGIVGATNLLLHEQVTLSQKRYFKIVQHSADHMLQLVNHILDYSKIEAGKISLEQNVFNLQSRLTDLCQVFETQHVSGNVQFSYHIDHQLNQTVSGDDLRLTQILTNLLANAFKFTPRGTVSFTASLKESTEQGICVLFAVKDTGIGIEKENLQQVFKSFEQGDNSTTRNFGGTGLGLSISRQLVQLLGGELQVNSEAGKGSEFYFSLQLKKAAAEKNPVTANTPPHSQNLSGINILVAEDNAVNRLILKNFLSRWKASFTEAVNGRKALECFNVAHYDLVLMDLEMPEMDGYTALAEIRKVNPSIPVLAFTAALYEGMAEDLQQQGFNDYLHKPFNPDDLYQKILRYQPKPNIANA